MGSKGTDPLLHQDGAADAQAPDVLAQHPDTLQTCGSAFRSEIGIFLKRSIYFKYFNFNSSVNIETKLNSYKFPITAG